MASHRARAGRASSSTSARTWSAGSRLDVEGERGHARSRCARRDARTPTAALHGEPPRRAGDRHATPCKGGGAGDLRAALHLPRLPLRRGHGLPASSSRRRSPAASSTRDMPRTRRVRVLGRAGQPAQQQHRLGPARQLPRRSPPTARSATSAWAGLGDAQVFAPHRDAATWTSPPSSTKWRRRRARRAERRRRLPRRRAAARRSRRDGAAGVGRRRRDRAVERCSAATATCGSSSATTTHGALRSPTCSATTPTYSGPQRRGNDYGDWLAVGDDDAAATSSRPRTGPTTRR